MTSHHALDCTLDRSVYPRLLVPIDGSKTSQSALGDAIKLAKTLNSHLRLLHPVNKHVLDLTCGDGNGLVTYLDCACARGDRSPS